MAKRYELRGKPATVFIPSHGSRLHLTTDRQIVYLRETTSACGRTMTVQIGGGRRPDREWAEIHESLRCQRCVKALADHGKDTQA